MASYTKNLGLLKKDPETEGADTFNVKTMLNENWDKVDEAMGGEKLAGEVGSAIAEAAAQSGTPDEKGAITRLLWSGLKVALKAVNDALYAAREHSHTKSEITDFPASMTPAAHKASHKTGGSDAIAPADIGAQEQHVTRAVALSAAGWSNKSQTVPVSGVTASNTVLLAPAPASQSAYGKAKIVCTAQGSGTLTFTCETVPTAAVNVNVVILEG